MMAIYFGRCIIGMAITESTAVQTNSIFDFELTMCPNRFEYVPSRANYRTDIETVDQQNSASDKVEITSL